VASQGAVLLYQRKTPATCPPRQAARVTEQGWFAFKVRSGVLSRATHEGFFCLQCFTSPVAGEEVEIEGGFLGRNSGGWAGISARTPWVFREAPWEGKGSPRPLPSGKAGRFASTEKLHLGLDSRPGHVPSLNNPRQMYLTAGALGPRPPEFVGRFGVSADVLWSAASIPPGFRIDFRSKAATRGRAVLRGARAFTIRADSLLRCFAGRRIGSLQGKIVTASSRAGRGSRRFSFEHVSRETGISPD